MNKEQKFFLKSLLETAGPSGFENKNAENWRKRTAKFADKVHGDYHGNSFAVLNEKGSPVVMIAGHIDEIGYMVNHIDEKGFIYFTTIGGIDPHIMPGQRVIIHNEKGEVPGIMGRKPIHVIKPEERGKVSKITSMWIDIGAKDKKEALKHVSIGDPITANEGFMEVLNDNVVARALDDRAGAFIVSEVIRILSQEIKTFKPAVYGVATVQEEVGLRGAITSAFSVNPDIGFAVDVTFATDHPEMDKRALGEVYLGKGPVLYRGANINPKLYDLLVRTAKKKKIPHQLRGAARGTGTDANAIQLSRGGTATALISIPNRYMHTPVEMCNLKDIENVAKLIAYTIKEIKSAKDFIL